MFHLCPYRVLETCGDPLRNQIVCFLSNQSFVTPKVPRLSKGFDLSWNSKLLLSKTTGFISSTNVTIETILLLKKISGQNDPFRFLRLTFDSPEV